MRRPETQLAAPMQAPCSPHTLALHPAADRTPRPSAPGPQLGLAPCARQLGEDGDDLGYEIAIEQELGYLKGVGATFDAKAKVGRPPQPHPSSSVHPGPSHRTAQHSPAQHSTAQFSTLRTCCAGACLGDVEGERGGQRARARNVCRGASASGNRWQRAGRAGLGG